MTRILFASVALLLGLQGCATDRPVGLITPQFGEAVTRNIAAQTVNPAAPEDPSPLTTDAQRAAIGQLRYVTDSVEKPAAVGTQATQLGGSGSSGAAAGGASGVQ